MSDTPPKEPLFAVFFTTDFNKPFYVLPAKSPGNSAKFTSFFTNIIFLLCLLCMCSSSSAISGVIGYSAK